MHIPSKRKSPCFYVKHKNESIAYAAFPDLEAASRCVGRFAKFYGESVKDCNVIIVEVGPEGRTQIPYTRTCTASCL